MSILAGPSGEMQVLRLASELIQRAKSGALVFGGFAQDDRVFCFVESGGDAGNERIYPPSGVMSILAGSSGEMQVLRLASELIQRAKKRRAGIRRLRSG
jgi:hypothetical protein